MDQASMRTLFGQLVGMPGVLEGTEIDEYLNRAWQYELPDRIGGNFREATYSWTLVAAKESYNLDTSDDVGSGVFGRIRQPKASLAIRGQTTPLVYFDDEGLFWSTYDRTSTAQGEPRSVLWFGRDLVFRPVPVGGEIIDVPCSAYPLELDDNGVQNGNHAVAAVRLAARQYALDFDLDERLVKLQAAMQDSLDLIRGQQHSRPKSVLRTRRLLA